MLGAVVAAATLASGVCAATPVHTQPLANSGSLSSLKWVQAAPARAGVFGVLFGYDEALQADPEHPTLALWSHGVSPTSSVAMKILWIVRNRSARGSVFVSGHALDGNRTYEARFGRVHDASARPAAGSEYASILDLPAGGCWQLDVSSGSAHGRLIARVADP